MVKKEKEENTRKATLVSVTYKDDKEYSIIKLFLHEKKKSYWLFDKKFHPYLYITVPQYLKEKKKEELEKIVFGENEKFKALLVSDTKRKNNEDAILQVFFKKVSHLVEARKYLNEKGFEKHEYDIPFYKRYLIDNRLEPGNEVILEIKNENELKKISQSQENKEFDVPMIAFDLETWCGPKFEVGKEPILMSSIVSEKEKIIYSYNTAKIKEIEILENEKELIEKTRKKIDSFDFIVTYNGDNFDFPYLKERARKFGEEFLINNEKIRVKRHGLDNAVELSGKQHIDAFQIIKFMQRTGSINTIKLDLETVSEKVFGIKKEKVYPNEINEAWKSRDEEKIERLADYNLKDSETTLRIAKEFLPMFCEISKLTSQTLSDSTRSSTSQMVEDLLIKETHSRQILAPNKPHEGEIRARMDNPIKGAFVKEPLAGLHENISVLDFASLYPSIIISHNISPETLNCSHSECKKNVSPDGTYFCTKQKGLFPEILENLLKKRLKLKAEYKKKKKEGKDDKVLFAKQWALKIILNSVYGYLGYPRARWYSRESASATTAWARKYITETQKKAEEFGFPVLYMDTDSCFLLMNKKTKKDIENFLDKINGELPETMELEFDGFYKRGIFVTKKEGGAAKKRYALIDEKGNLKIVGFEYVRRDWCEIAKETQKKVIELVLKEGNPEEAIKYIRKIIVDLRKGKVAKRELAIITMLKRKTADYDSVGPHVAAAKKAIEKGKELSVGSLLSFIITKNGKTISDKAELEEFVEEGNYDAEYYIENQVIPAVIKIVRELGYTKEDLIQGGKQSGLGQWF